MKRFEDNIVVVTGGTSGIGLAVSELFLREGAHVIAVARNARQGEEAAEKLRATGNESHEFFRCDISSSSDVAALFAYVNKKYGRLDVLHNNAGVSIGSDIEHTLESEWEQTINVNLKGYFLCTQAAIPLLKKGEKKAIVNTISELGFVATPGCIAYLCSKGGIVQLTRGCAVELAQYGIRVNAVCPAGTESEMFYNDMKNHVGGYDVSTKALAASYPLGRIAIPMDIAPAVLFLASKEASFITGTHILLDGGFTAT